MSTSSTKLGALFLTLFFACFSDCRLPDKAIELIHEAGARVCARHAQFLEATREFRREFRQVIKSKNEARPIGKEYRELMRRAEELRFQIGIFHEASKAGKVVTEADIQDIVSSWTGIPAKEVISRLVNVEETLHKQVIDQDEAVKAVNRACVGLRNPMFHVKYNSDYACFKRNHELSWKFIDLDNAAGFACKIGDVSRTRFLSSPFELNPLKSLSSPIESDLSFFEPDVTLRELLDAASGSLILIVFGIQIHFSPSFSPQSKVEEAKGHSMWLAWNNPNMKPWDRKASEGRKSVAVQESSTELNSTSRAKKTRESMACEVEHFDN
ncbi:hypothetical protein GQ457_06G042090 [Hibiscus cannabinus]